MEKKYLEEQINLAKELVADVDEPYKTIAFGVVLTNLLGLNIQGNKGVIKKLTVDKKDDIDFETEITTNVEKLATDCKLSAKEIGDVITIRNGAVEIVAPINGTEPERQVIATQCVLIVHEIVFQEDWVKTNVIKEALRKSGIQDKSGHLSKYLKNKPVIFRMRGSGLGAEYKLTTPGRIQAFQTIQNLVKGEKLHEN